MLSRCLRNECQFRPPYGKFPIYRGDSFIGRLTRDLAFKGQGIGELLLVDALNRSLTMSLNIASMAVIVTMAVREIMGF